MNVLFDTNVILDVMLDRKPFSAPASILLTEVERGEIFGFLSATTITTIHYLATKTVGSKKAQIEISKLLTLFEIAPVNRAVLESVVKSENSDFEDAIICEAAVHVGAQSIVTRDLKGFKKSALPVYTPDELINMVNALKE